MIVCKILKARLSILQTSDFYVFSCPVCLQDLCEILSLIGKFLY